MDWAVQRNEDMSPRGRLRLIKQDDGDIIVCSQGETRDGLIEPGSGVEFCNSGGHSPNTLRALHALYEAMEQDNREHPLNLQSGDHS